MLMTWMLFASGAHGAISRPGIGPNWPQGRNRHALTSQAAALGPWRSLVSALDWGSRGREFKSPRPDRKPRGQTKDSPRISVRGESFRTGLQTVCKRASLARGYVADGVRAGSPRLLQHRAGLVLDQAPDNSWSAALPLS